MLSWYYRNMVYFLLSNLHGNNLRCQSLELGDKLLSDQLLDFMHGSGAGLLNLVIYIMVNFLNFYQYMLQVTRSYGQKLLGKPIVFFLWLTGRKILGYYIYIYIYMLQVAICPIGRDFYGCYIYIFGSYRVFHGGILTGCITSISLKDIIVVRRSNMLQRIVEMFKDQ